ncbi:hypothetical protein ACFZC6_45375 [Streptomyces ossamyceticus]|uniref:FAD dependent oxidoreductase n=1 Tax=Streptomyces ossamyceticus TaxID=249581 RepID=A0ABV2VB55_9ACTN
MVIGGGPTGLSTAYHAARKGAHVVPSWRRTRSARAPPDATAACVPRASPSAPPRRASATGSRGPGNCTTPSARRWTSWRS